MLQILFPEIDFAVDAVPNLYGMLADIRAKQRMATVRWFGEPATLFTRYDDVIGGLRDDRPATKRLASS